MADGVVSVRGVPDRKLSLAELSTIASSPTGLRAAFRDGAGPRGPPPTST